MPVPSPRSKLLPARGNYSDLLAGIASILDGEIVYAADEDQHYQNEGGTLVAVGATKAQGTLADSAVQPGDLATVATSGEYSDLSNPPSIPSGINDLSDVDTATAAPTDGQVLTWVNADSEWQPADAAGGATSINDLSDVDTATVAPTDGQVLTWVNADSEWQPADAAGGGGASAINDLTDVAITSATQGEVLGVNASGTFENIQGFQITHIAVTDGDANIPTAVDDPGFKGEVRIDAWNWVLYINTGTYDPVEDAAGWLQVSLTQVASGAPA